VDLPGYAPAGQAKRPPTLTLGALDQAFRRYILDDYHQQPHSATGVPPQARWSGSGFLPQMPESLEQLDLLLLTVAKARQVHQDGIRFQALRYIDLTLAAYVGESVTVRYDPRDMAEIRVYHKDRFLCRAVCQELAGETISLKDIARARNRRKRELHQVITARRSLVDQVLTPPPMSNLSPEPLPLSASVPLQQSRIKRYAQD
jgi:putative transposase